MRFYPSTFNRNVEVLEEIEKYADSMYDRGMLSGRFPRSIDSVGNIAAVSKNEDVRDVL